MLVRNWRPWVELKVHAISAPMSFHSRVALDFPVSLGGYRHPRDPAEPMCLHLVHVAGAPMQGLTAREQFRIGQRQAPADAVLRVRGSGSATSSTACSARAGFPSARDIAAITVNRWPHGYGYVKNTLFDATTTRRRRWRLARQPAGRVAIANSDSGGDAYAHLAIDAAARAVRELTG